MTKLVQRAGRSLSVDNAAMPATGCPRKRCPKVYASFPRARSRRLTSTATGARLAACQNGGAHARVRVGCAVRSAHVSI